MMSSSVRLPTTGYRALRTISSGSASAAVASFTRMPFLPCTRRNSALISPSTFFSARTLILWTSWISNSTSPSINSVLRTWHSAASRVSRTGGAAAGKSEGYIFVARAPQPAQPPRRRPRGEAQEFLFHPPPPPPRHDLLRHPLEQVRRQADRVH